MANYTKVFTKPYADGYEDLPSQTTPITAETLNDKDDTLEHIEDYLYNNPIVEVVDNLTTNDATKALSAKQGKVLNDTKLNVADLPNSDVQTSTTGQFTTVTGGLLNKCEVELTPIQSGSGTPSPTNIRPISGHTQVQVGNVGKNRLPLTVAFIKSINTSGTWSGNNYSVSGLMFSLVTDSDNNNNVIAVKVTGTASATVMFVVGYYTDTRYDFILNGCPSSGSSSTYNLTPNGSTPDIGKGISVPTSSSWNGYISIYVYNNYACPTSGLLFKPMLRLSTESDATFVPYNGYTVTINLGGIRYGGTLDAVSGVLTVDKGFMTFDGSSDEGWALGSNDRMYIVLTNCLSGGWDVQQTTSECNEFGYNTNVYNQNVEGFYIAQGYLYVRKTGTTTVADFKTFLSGSALQIAYKIATPQTIQLTPTQFETLVGQNNLSAPLDGQTVEEVEYREVLAFEDVPKAIPYECVDPDVGTGEMFTFFTIHRYGRVVVLKFDDLDATPVVSEDGWVNLGRLPERFYHKYPNQMSAENMIFGVINDDNNTLQMKKLIIDQYNGDVKIYFLANEQIKPLGSITYILDHD